MSKNKSVYHYNGTDSFVMFIEHGFAIKIYDYLTDLRNIFSKVNSILNDLTEYLSSRQSSSFALMKFFSNEIFKLAFEFNCNNYLISQSRNYFPELEYVA